MQVFDVERASGAVLKQAVIKTYPSEEEMRMAEHLHNTLIGGLPLLYALKRSIIFPLGSTNVSVDEALTLLKRIWVTSERGNRTYSAATYCEYATRACTLDVPALYEHRALLRKASDVVLNTPANCTEVHGDATLENFVRYKGQAFWIDPSYRPCVAHKELDISKLMFSINWHPNYESITRLALLYSVNLALLRAHYILNCARVITRGSKRAMSEALIKLNLITSEG